MNRRNLSILASLFILAAGAVWICGTVKHPRPSADELRYLALYEAENSNFVASVALPQQQALQTFQAITENPTLPLTNRMTARNDVARITHAISLTRNPSHTWLELALAAGRDRDNARVPYAVTAVALLILAGILACLAFLTAKSTSPKP